MKKRIVIGIIFGVLAGIIDVVPMIIQKLPWDANISAFSLWVVCGLLIAITEIKIHPVLKGLVLAFALLLPCAVIIGWKEPYSLIPIIGITAVLASALGYTIEKLGK
ncbi:MAG TPA: hypothetical protein PKI01_08355 [Bacteroidales bacterium]|nr:hypothetical protein [Bacteroidales bacterium]